ncbi:NagB/RpiA/CoA transferase-like superfamily protein [Actinidia rufa]|uniref:ribose-5-phosphate isomerase n=1 Tax=Actinidia rufa TaxID=165716 RepID=A0A7J0G5V2_9ERIC|nr:NagB/RpiA/CoA transferase-like superfamily protein [Actinidia rufa]
MAVAVMPSISTQNLHFQANHKKGYSFGLGSQARRLNSLLSIPRSSLLDSSSAYLLEFAAKSTVDTFIKSGMVVGLGSGLASHMAIQYLGRQLRLGTIKDIVGIPTSVSSASEAVDAGIPLDHYQDSSQVCTISTDADIIEEGTLISVIGRQRLQGEESIIQEKFNWMETAEEIDDLFLVEAEVWRRPSIGHAGPLGGDFPLITREGHNVLDLIFTSPILNLAEVAKCLDDIDGVVDHGVISKIP